MAVLAAILPVVSRTSALALELYKAAAESPEAAKELVAVANKINGFAGILKQTGTIIREDDRLPSPEVCRLRIHKCTGKGWDTQFSRSLWSDLLYDCHLHLGTHLKAEVIRKWPGPLQYFLSSVDTDRICRLSTSWTT